MFKTLVFDPWYLIPAWIFGGIISAGITYAYFKHQFPKYNHTLVTLGLFVLGPLGLFASWKHSERCKHGWRLPGLYRIRISRQTIMDGWPLPPWYFGLGYWHYDFAYYYPVPVNYLVRFRRRLVLLWDRIRSRPTDLDRLTAEIGKECRIQHGLLSRLARDAEYICKRANMPKQCYPESMMDALLYLSKKAEHN